MDIRAEQSRILNRHGTRRRRTLLGAIALWFAPWVPVAAGSVGKAAQRGGSSAKRFLEFSRLATGQPRLDAALGATLFATLVKHDRAFTSKLALLDQFAQRRKIADVETLDAALQGNPLRADLKGIVAAWYSGAVGEGPHAEEVTYTGALMYEPSADGSHNPGICAGATNSWDSLPRPPLDVLPKT